MNNEQLGYNEVSKDENVPGWIRYRSRVYPELGHEVEVLETDLEKPVLRYVPTDRSVKPSQMNTEIFLSLFEEVL